MIDDIRLKICGLRREVDAHLAARLGADYLGFILYPKSPRYLALEDYAALAPRLPAGPERVAVLVEPSSLELDHARAGGFDRFQIHARHDIAMELVRGWSKTVGASKLWLAPKLPPDAAFPAEWLGVADTFLVDTFHSAGFGGSGRVGDWAGFRRLAEVHPDKTLVLAGGLAPDNVAAARARSGARFMDVNSGVESAPGEKSADKLHALAAALTRAGAEQPG